MKDRIEGWLGGTYRIFQNQKVYLNYFRNLNHTDEAYANAVNLFRRYLSKTDPKKDGNLTCTFESLNSTEYYEEAKF